MKTELVYLKSLFGVVKVFLSGVFYQQQNKTHHPSGMARWDLSRVKILCSGQQG
jgi:hypothetical protein